MRREFKSWLFATVVPEVFGQLQEEEEAKQEKPTYIDQDFLDEPEEEEEETMSNQVVESRINLEGITIKQDAEGRYCLNDLHKASGGERRNEPAFFLENQSTKSLVEEITGNPVFSKRGRNGGTYVVKELVYAYAMWISPSFHLKVIRAYDQMVAQPKTQQPALPDFSDPVAAARAWADEYEHKQKALAQVEEQQRQLEEARPSVEFVDRYVNSETGTKNFRQVAKLLQANEREFRKFLKDSNIMYKLGGEWMPYQYPLDQKYFVVRTGTSGDHSFCQAKFTPKGIRWIASKWARYQVIELTSHLSILFFKSLSKLLGKAQVN